MSVPLRGKLVLSEPLAAVLLIVLATACAGLLFAQQRAIVPRELPSLTLPPEPVQRVLRADAQAARAVPRSDRALALEALLLEHGRSESKGLEDESRYRERRAALKRGYSELAAEAGAEAALRLRARAVQKLDATLALELPKDEAKAVLGSFPAVLAHQGVTRNGELVAPEFVARTIYKARWNLLHGLSHDHGFALIEKRAYYGWRALHAPVPLPQRINALHAYGLAGGEDVEEALGLLLLRAGDAAQAAPALQRAYERHGNLRIRNALLETYRRSMPVD